MSLKLKTIYDEFVIENVKEKDLWEILELKYPKTFMRLDGFDILDIEFSEDEPQTDDEIFEIITWIQEKLGM